MLCSWLFKLSGSVSEVCDLLGIEAQSLEQCLCSRRITTGSTGEQFMKPCSTSECVERRDCIAKLVYSRYDFSLEFDYRIEVCARPLRTTEYWPKLPPPPTPSPSLPWWGDLKSYFPCVSYTRAYFLFIYFPRLFDWIVNFINISIKAPPDSKHSFIGKSRQKIIIIVLKFFPIWK